MSQLLLYHNQMYQRGVHARTLSSDVFRWQYALAFVLLLIIAGLGLLYLMRFSNSATKGYEITRLEIERNSLLNEREVLNMRIAEERSLPAFLAENSKISSMVPSNSPEYFRPGSEVAQR